MAGVRGYRAGTAYVEVLPVFGDSQQMISNHLRKALNNKESFKGINEAIRDQIVKGAEDAEPEVRAHLEKSADRYAKNIAKTIKENGKLSVTEIERQERAAIKSARESAGAWRREMGNAVKLIDKELGELGKGRSGRGKSVFARFLGDAREEIEGINKALDGTITRSDADMKRSYQRLTSIVKEMNKLQPGANVLSETDAYNINRALEQISKHKASVEKLMTATQVREARAREAALQKEIDDELAARKKATEEKIKLDKIAEKERREADEAAAARRQKAYDESLKADRAAAKRRSDWLARSAQDLEAWDEFERKQIKDAEGRRKADADALERHQRKMIKLHIQALKEDERRTKAKETLRDREERAERQMMKLYQLALDEDARRQKERERIRKEAEASAKAASDARDQELADTKRQNDEAVAARRKFLADSRAVDRHHRRVSADEMAGYDDTLRTRMDETPRLGHERVGINRRQEAAIGRLSRETNRLTGDIQRAITTLTALNSTRPVVTISTNKARTDILDLERHLALFSRKEFKKELEVDVDDSTLSAAVGEIKGAVNSIEDVHLDIEVEDEAAKAKIEALRTYLAQLKADDYDVLIDVDAEGVNKVRAELTRLTNDVHELNIIAPEPEVRAALERIDQAIDAIDGKTVGVDITERQARANIAIIRQDLERLDHMDVDVEVDVDFRKSALEQLQQFEAQMDRGGRRVRSLNRAVKEAGISLSETTQAFRIFNPVLAAVVFAGGPAVSTIGGLTAGLGALVSVLPAAAGGFAPLMAAFWGLGDAAKNYEKYQESIAIKADERTKAQQAHVDAWEAETKTMGEATEAWIKYSSEFMPRLAGIQDAAREGLFPGLMTSIDNLFAYEKPLTDFMGKTAKMLGDISERWSTGLTSQPAAAWFKRVAEDAEIYVPALLLSVENIVVGFANLTDAFRPFAREFVSWLVNMTGRWKDWTDGLSASDRFTDFLDSVRSTLPGIADAGKGILELFTNLVIAVEPFTLAMMDATNFALDFLNAMDPGHLSAILGAVGGLVGGLMILSGVMAGVGAVAAIVNAASGSLITTVAFGLAGFIATSSAALGATVALEGGVGGLWGELLGLSEGLYQIKDATGAFVGFVMDVFDALSPLLPVVFDLTSLLIGLSTGALQVVVEALGPVVWILGLVADFLSLFPGEILVTVAALLTLAGTANKLRDSLDSAYLYASYFFGDLKKGAGNIKDVVIGAVDDLGGRILGVADNSGKAAANVGSLGGRLIGLAGGVLGIVAIAGAMKLYNDAQEEAKRRTEIFEATMKGFDSTMMTSAESVTSMRTALNTLFESNGPLWNNIADMDDAMSRLDNDKWWMPISKMNNAFAGLGETIKGADSGLRGMVEGGNIGQAVLAYDELAAAAERNDVSHEELNKRLPEFTSALEIANAELDTGISNEELLAELREGRVPEALINAMEASEKYGGAVDGVGNELSEADQATRELMDVTDQLAGRFASAEEAQIAYRDRMREVGEAIAETGAITDWGSEQGDRYKEMLIGIARDGLSVVETQAKQGASEEELQEHMKGTYDALVATAEQMGMGEEQAIDYARELLDIPDDVPTDAYIKNYAKRMTQIEDMDGSLAELERQIRVEVLVEAVYEDFEQLSKLQADNPGARIPSPYTGQHDGAVLEHYAKGGLKPMDPIAQMVKPNTWRVVGDRMKDDEAYIPLDGSPRSKAILFEAIERMPGLFMEQGGIVNFAVGGVAAAPAAGGAEASADATMAPVAEAFAALEAQLREGYTSLLTEMLGLSQAFFDNLLAATEAHNEALLTGDAEWRAQMTAGRAEYLANDLAGLNAHLATSTAAWANFRANDLSANSDYLSNLLARTREAQGELRGAWSSTHSDLASRGATYRSGELSQFDRFYGDLLSQMTGFGSNARTEWDRIWRELTSSAASIFGQLPRDVSGILVDVSKTLNKHIVDPFNKIIKDLDLEKISPITSFPTQSYATGGHVALRSGGFMPGYTPGRDVHTFYSNTGGILELSGGEPVLRPEAGVVLGRDWVDGVNMAARSGGVRGVQDFLAGPRQAFADGGVWQNLWGIVHEQFPTARLTSGRRYGSGRSYHNRGMAVDVAGPTPMDVPFMKRIYEFLHDNYGNSNELIFTPGGGKNILNGRYHQYNAATVANHRDHVHWANSHRFSDVVGPPTGQSAMGLYDITGNMDSWVDAARKAMGDGFMQSVAMDSYAGLFSEVAKQKQDAFITDHAHIANDPGGPGGGVGRWRSMVRMALDHVGQPATEAMQNIVLRRMNQESGGNPRAINLWDINARRGIPSKGLMQVIDPTFRAYRDRSLVNDIWDPMANIVASMNYALARYGSLPKAYNRRGGYALGTAGIDLADLGLEPLLRDRGGRLPEGLSLIQNSLGHSETVIPETPENVARAFEDFQANVHAAEAGVVIKDSVFTHSPRETADEIYREGRVQLMATSVPVI